VSIRFQPFQRNRQICDLLQLRVVLYQQRSDGVVVLKTDAAEVVVIEIKLGETVVFPNFETIELVVVEIKKGKGVVASQAELPQLLPT
jgi:hypothetical protein